MQNDVSPQMLLAFWQAAWNAATDKANTFRDQLLIEQGKQLQFVRSGTIVTVSKNSAHHSYGHFGPGQLTQAQIVEAYGTLVLLYDKTKEEICKAFLRNPEFGQVPDGYDFDGPVYGVIFKRLQDFDTAQVRPDITNLNLPGEGLPVANFSGLFSW
jgi:hypothetical protein